MNRKKDRNEKVLFVILSMRTLPGAAVEEREGERLAQLMFIEEDFETSDEAREWIRKNGRSWQRYMILEAIPGGQRQGRLE